MRHLTNLNLSHNALTTLPTSIGLMRQLKMLIVSHNKLSHLPTSISNLNLNRLILDHNQISTIPKEIGYIKELTHLDFSFNPISIIPAELSGLERLKIVALDGCPLIQELPFYERKIPTLKELAARVIVQHQLSIHQLTNTLMDYISTSQSCSFCHGPFFEVYVSRFRFIHKWGHRLVLEHRLCIAHWHTDQERIALLFAPLPVITPRISIKSLQFTPSMKSLSLPNLRINSKNFFLRRASAVQLTSPRSFF